MKKIKVDWEKLLEDFDWKGLAEGYQKEKTSWSAGQWRDFYEHIVKKTKREVTEKFLDDLGYAYIHDKDGRKNIRVLINLYTLTLEELKNETT